MFVIRCSLSPVSLVCPQCGLHACTAPVTAPITAAQIVFSVSCQVRPLPIWPLYSSSVRSVAACTCSTVYNRALGPAAYRIRRVCKGTWTPIESLASVGHCITQIGGCITQPSTHSTELYCFVKHWCCWYWRQLCACDGDGITARAMRCGSICVYVAVICKDFELQDRARA